MQVRVSRAPRGAALVLLVASAGALAQQPAAQAPAVPQRNAAETPAASRDAAGERIIVTGTAVPVALREVGSAVTVIDREAIERRNAAYLQDILREVPGVAVNQAGSFGQLAQVRIRGAEADHTLVLVDGIEVSAMGQGEFDFSSLMAANIERVEVLRGPQSGLYGSNALAGVINVITRGGEGPLLDAAVEGGSFGTIMGRGAMTLGNRETFLAASGAVRSTTGISAAEAGEEADGDHNITAYLRGGYAIAPFARLDGSFRFVDKDTETDAFDFSGGPLQGLTIDDDSFSATQEVSGGLALTLTPTQNIETVFTGAYAEAELFGGNGDTASFGSRGDRLKLGGRLSLIFDTGAELNHGLAAFADYERETYRNTFPFDPTQVPEQRRSLLGLGAEYRLALFDSLFLKAALRHDENSRFQDATTYSLTGSWVIASTGSRLHASYGKGATNPTFSEQFGFTPGQFVGNPDLLPEEAKSWDIGVEQRFGDAVLVDMTYFSSKLSDEIIALFPTVVNDRGESDRKGVELGARVDLGWVDLGGTYTWLGASDPDGTREVRRPEHQASLDASAEFGPARRGKVNVGVIYNGKMLDTDFREYFTNGFVSKKTALKPFFVVHAAATYRILEQLELFGRVENLLDEEYQEVISYGTPRLSAYGGIRLILP
jgi:vitamin B12 transporter